MKVIITGHGERRMRERLGIPKRSCNRVAQRAWDEGIRISDTNGPLRRNLDFRRFQKSNADDVFILYQEHVFLFSEDGYLITVMPIDPQVKSSAKKQKKFTGRIK